MITEIGPHKVRHGNIMDGLDELMGNETADFVYSDPPWGQGNLKYWQTMNQKMTGTEPVEISFEEFLPFFFSQLRKYAKDTVLIEYGVRWREKIFDVAAQCDFVSGGVARSFYGSKKQSYPLDIHILSKSGKAVLTDEFAAQAEALNKQRLVHAAFDAYAPEAGLVLDPMCGMGFTAQSAIDRGMTFRGNEVNQARLDKTIARLEKSLR